MHILEENILTDREKEIIQLICLGNNYKEIANKLFISLRTVQNHRANISNKLLIKSNAGLVLYALKHEIIKWDKIDEFYGFAV